MEKVRQGLKAHRGDRAVMKAGQEVCEVASPDGNHLVVLDAAVEVAIRKIDEGGTRRGIHKGA